MMSYVYLAHKYLWIYSVEINEVYNFFVAIVIKLLHNYIL